ncbi:hypothetical protein AURDEDRAFT_189054 [Auricularia subglabra TFB-10046 SS5]|uniref:Uncharacterized protein n=1 Tax=Auricularia subglabra (strain TFB-10046 / SS5) TaxID=717982 RepID=J0WP90_AURST|nr:hypothetical protein AURDEDRAFT_189054 [Auricularia subglabra TFB-10046 SS5]
MRDPRSVLRAAATLDRQHLLYILHARSVVMSMDSQRTAGGLQRRGSAGQVPDRHIEFVGRGMVTAQARNRCCLNSARDRQSLHATVRFFCRSGRRCPPT